MKIMLVCAAGMSTTLLKGKMLKLVEEGDIVDAFQEDSLSEVIDNYDCVLVGPQLRYKYKYMEAIAKEHHKPIALIDMIVYGTIDGKMALQQANDLVRGGKEK